MAALATVACFVAGCDHDQPPAQAQAPAPAPAPAPNNVAKTAAEVPEPLVVCNQPWDYRIVVHFSSSQCPISVGPVELKPGATECNSKKANCIPRKTDDAGSKRASKIVWQSDTDNMEFGVYFDPFVGTKHDSTNGCSYAVIAGNGGEPNDIPPVSSGEVMYKYTIAKLKLPGKTPDEGCPPLDPGIIIEH